MKTCTCVQKKAISSVDEVECGKQWSEFLSQATRGGKQDSLKFGLVAKTDHQR